ncbi:unnamed protein product [Rangifer tarandus platyrhynchus]|uniref:Uncharacterized protein n=2 Tax=Rangifer tarandus platyrhynchus TaxID=3082113 RepID=A0ACB0F944_RANTA|nr:unnamed protein product [Rangifer tarandus platyrhynchus]CAI9709565.1 unnamed protein product [Rangifer tarandus platyrhynchus]
MGALKTAVNRGRLSSLLAQQWQHPSPPRFQSSVALPRLYTHIQSSFYIVAKDHIFRLCNGAPPPRFGKVVSAHGPDTRAPAFPAGPRRGLRSTETRCVHTAGDLSAATSSGHPAATPLSAESKPETHPALQTRVLGLQDLTPPASQLFLARP